MKTDNLEDFVRPCNHNGKTYVCNTITLSDIKNIRKRYYETANKIDQEIKICHISVTPIERKRPVKTPSKSRQFSATYYLKISTNSRSVRIRLPFLTATLGISKRRVSHVANCIYECKVPKENRGGDKISKNSEGKK